MVKLNGSSKSYKHKISNCKKAGNLDSYFRVGILTLSVPVRKKTVSQIETTTVRTYLSSLAWKLQIIKNE